MQSKQYTIDEICDRGEQIYEEQIRHLVEPRENGKFIAIDVESGDYEVAEEELDASHRLKARRPESVRFLAKIGCKAAYRLGIGTAEFSGTDAD